MKELAATIPLDALERVLVMAMGYDEFEEIGPLDREAIKLVEREIAQVRQAAQRVS